MQNLPWHTMPVQGMSGSGAGALDCSCGFLAGALSLAVGADLDFDAGTFLVSALGSAALTTAAAAALVLGAAFVTAGGWKVGSNGSAGTRRLTPAAANAFARMGSSELSTTNVSW